MRQLAQDFVAAIAGTATANVIDADNRSIGTVSTGAAVTSGSPFAVTPHPALAVFDLDDPVTAAALATLLRRAAEAAGTPMFAAASGTPGHQHIFVNCGNAPHPVDAARIRWWARQNRVDLRTAGIRPPGTVHRSGGASIVLSPDTPGSALSALRAQPPGGGWRRLATALGVPDLSNRMRDTVTGGHRVGNYHSPSESRLALAAAGIGAGFDIGFVTRVLDHPRCEIGKRWRAESERWRAAERERLETKARMWVTRNRQDPDPWWAALTAQSWRGRSGVSVLAIAEAFHRRAQSSGAGVIYPLAEIAADAGLSRAAARRAVRALTSAGWLVVSSAPTATRAARFELRIVGTAAHLEAPTYGFGHDAARWKALGKSVWRVWKTLDPKTPTRPVDVARTLGVTPSTVQRHLKKLAENGMAARVTGGWVSCEGDPRAVAVRYGTDGAQERDRVVLHRERAARAAARAQARHLLPDGTVHVPRRQLHALESR